MAPDRLAEDFGQDIPTSRPSVSLLSGSPGRHEYMKDLRSLARSGPEAVSGRLTDASPRSSWRTTGCVATSMSSARSAGMWWSPGPFSGGPTR